MNLCNISVSKRSTKSRGAKPHVKLFKQDP